MAARRWRLTKLCAACQERKARFKYRGRVKADRDHVLCMQCWRAEMNRTRATQLSFPWQEASASSVRLSGPSDLDDRQRAHRERMLAHLRNQ